MMFLKKIPLALASVLLLGNSWAQRTFTYNIPASESKALSQIVEDDPSDQMTIAKSGGDRSPQYKLVYQKALVIPPVKQPLKIVKNPLSGKDIFYYEIEIKKFTKQVYPNLRAATFTGYDGISPGPTIVVPRGTESIVRFINNAEHENSVHLHGSPSRAPFDGWAEDITRPGEYKDYYYPNNQAARLLWYHDHAMHITAENANAGQAGAYIITDPADDALGLPSGKYDVPLILASRHYNDDGNLRSTVGEEDSYWGDINEVNGVPFPFFNVEPRKYRLRFLNAAVSRSFALYFARSTALSTRLPFKVIASDSGLLSDTVQVSQLYLSNAERYEVVFDFSSFAGQSIDLRNLPEAGGIGVEDDFDNSDKVMRFNVAKGTVTDSSRVPAKLATLPAASGSTTVNHHFRFHRTNSEWRINGVGFADVQNRVLAKVPRGTREIWELENSSGGWTHPIHVHLVDFRVLKRTGGRGVMPYEANGLKDVVWLGKGETAIVEAHYFGPWDGSYMFHCHNLIHEDIDMMAVFNVTQLADFGYTDTGFFDPMEPKYRAKPYQLTDLRSRTGPFSDANILAKIDALARDNPYPDPDAVEAGLKDYWAARNKAVRGNELDGRAIEGPEPQSVPRYRRIKF